LKGPDAKRAWKEAGCFELISPLDEVKRAVQRVADEEGDVSAEVKKHLSDAFPTKLDFSKIVNLGNVHMDLRMRSPEGKWLIGWTLDTPSVLLQFLEGGRIEYLIRNKFLENQPRDNIVSQRKCPNELCPASLDDEMLSRWLEDTFQEARQPMVWLKVVTPKKPEYWAEPGEVGATKGTAGRLLFGDAGDVAFGVSKPDYHEYFFWFDRHPEISGRWGWQLIAGRPEYAKVGEEWWMGNKPHISLGPYILTHNRKTEEAKARKEKFDLVLWVPHILTILARDEKGREWLRDQLKRVRLPAERVEGPFDFLSRYNFDERMTSFLNAKFEEFSANEGRWERKA